MFNKRNLSSLKNRKPSENPEENEGGECTYDSWILKSRSIIKHLESEENKERKVKVFKKRTIAKINVTNDKENKRQKNEDVPLESNLVNLQESEAPVNRATSTYEIDTEKSMDHRSILERNLEIGKKILEGELESKVYRGQGAYRPIMNVREGSIAASKYTGLYGPVRASATNVRTTLRIDYQPDICKDYKETGYCGFGDTCKFLHDRSDYKSGWQLEKEWEQEQAEKRLKMQKKLEKWHKRIQSGVKEENEDEEEEEEEEEETESDTDSDDSDGSSESSERGEEEVQGTLKKMMKYKAKKLKVPFCCLSCKKMWKKEMNPMVTSCGHYFCERCIIEAYSTNMKCPKCKVVQDGIMNRASAVEKLIESVIGEES